MDVDMDRAEGSKLRGGQGTLSADDIAATLGLLAASAGSGAAALLHVAPLSPSFAQPTMIRLSDGAVT